MHDVEATAGSMMLTPKELFLVVNPGNCPLPCLLQASSVDASHSFRLMSTYLAVSQEAPPRAHTGRMSSRKWFPGTRALP